MSGLDYSATAKVYTLTVNHASGKCMLKSELSEIERTIINAGTRIGNSIAKCADECGFPLPAEVLVTPEKSVICYGKAFKHECDFSNTKYVIQLNEIVREGAIRYITIRRVAGFPFTYISYGRRGYPEFTTSVYSKTGKAGKKDRS